MSLVLLILLPAACLLLPEEFFLDRTKTANSSEIQPIFFILALLIVPTMLWALSKSNNGAFVLGFAFSSASALWFAWCIKPKFVLLAIVIIALSLRYDVLISVVSIGAGLGAAQLIASRMKNLAVFALAFCLLDCVLVASGLVDAATSQMPLLGGFSLGDLPLYNRISIDGYMLGAGDIFFAGIIASLVKGKTPILIFILAQTTLLVLASINEWSVPATIPGTIALIYYLASRKWSRQSQELLAQG